MTMAVTGQTRVENLLLGKARCNCGLSLLPVHVQSAKASWQQTAAVKSDNGHIPGMSLSHTAYVTAHTITAAEHFCWC